MKGRPRTLEEDEIVGFKEIGKTLGISPQRAHQIYTSAVRKLSILAELTDHTRAGTKLVKITVPPDSRHWTLWQWRSKRWRKLLESNGGPISGFWLSPGLYRVKHERSSYLFEVT